MASKKKAAKKKPAPARQAPRFGALERQALELRDRARAEAHGPTSLALRVEALELVVAELVAAAKE